MLRPGRNLTWAEFGTRVELAAGVLAALDIKSGDRFGILARNGVVFEELKWAGFSTGVVPVPINWRLAPPEIQHILEDSACKCVFAEEEFLPNFDQTGLTAWRDGLISLPDQYDRYMGNAERRWTISIDPHDDAILLYTGGTTGRSKGVRLSHSNIVSNALAFGLGAGARQDDIYLHAAPMFHSADTLATAWFLVAGAHCYLPDFSPENFLSAVASYRVTTTVAVPAMLMAIVSHPGFKDADISSMRSLLYGAAPMALEWIQRVASGFPHVRFSNIYGLTEASPLLTIFDAKEFRAAIETGDPTGIVRSVGKANVLNELRVVDSNGDDVPPGEVGELWARGPNIMNGYLNLPEQTEAAIVDGWLRTGDMASIDEDGYVYLLDRLKDMIISGGENVYASEVEAALHRHPGVHEATVIGVPDDRLGEALVAVIVPAPGAKLDADELIAHCRLLIGGYKIPRRYAFVDALPKSALGKILKHELRATYG